MTEPNLAQLTKQLEQGNRKDFVQSLSDAYNHLSHSDFKSMLDQLKQQNEKDLKSNKNLPGLEIGTDSVDRPQVTINTPGKYLSNLWRNEEVAWTAHTIGTNIKDLITDSHVAANSATSKDSRAIGESVALANEAAYNEKQDNQQAASTLFDSGILAAEKASSKEGKAIGKVYALDAKADYYDRQGRTEDARKLYEQADNTARDLSNPEYRAFASSFALDSHAKFLEKHGKTADAEKMFNQAVVDSISPEKPPLWYESPYAIATTFSEIEKADFLDRTGRTTEAGKLYDAAIKDGEGAYNLEATALAKSVAQGAKAQFLERHGDIDHAIDLYNLAASTASSTSDLDRRTPALARVYDTAAAAFERNGRPDEATMLYDQAYDFAIKSHECNPYGIGASSAIIAKYEFLDRQRAGIKVGFVDLPKVAEAAAFQLGVSAVFLPSVRKEAQEVQH